MGTTSLVNWFGGNNIILLSVLVLVLVQVPFYIVAQITGSMIASFTLRELLESITSDIGTTTPSGTDFQALVMEVVVTFSMMFVASAVSTDTKAVSCHHVIK